MSTRFFTLSFFFSLLALSIALISQHVFDLRPCAWCVFQRLLVILLMAASVIGLVGSWLSQTWLRLLARLVLLLLSVGGVIAAWYQYHVAAKLFSCDMTFADKFMTQSGLESSYPAVFGIYASCMDAAVNVLGLDYALWALCFFALMAIAALISFFK